MTGDWLAMPGAWPWLLAAPALWLLLQLRQRTRARQLAALLGPRADVLAREVAPGRRRLARSLTVAATLLAALALLQPRWGKGHGLAPRGLDLVVCLDVSRSMLARDMAPSRLERAREELRALATRADGDRLALVAFAGEARLLVPLTPDRASFALLAAQADPLSVGRGGTDLAAALRTGLAAAAAGSGDHTALLLVTDGEDPDQRGLAAARECADAGLRVHCLVLGSLRGAKIPLAGPDGEVFLRDAGGAEVVSVPDRGGLRAIAEATGGELLEATAASGALTDLYDRRLVAAARATYQARARAEAVPRFQWPLLAAFLLWLCELCLSQRRSGRRA